MGYSVTLTHILMVISSIVLASVFSAYAFYAGNLVQNELMQNANDYKRLVNMQLEIVYATVDSSTTPPHFVIYVKNVGNLPLKDYSFLDVYVGGYGEAQLSSTILTRRLEAGSSAYLMLTETGFGSPVKPPL